MSSNGKHWIESKSYLEGEGVNDLAQLMRLSVKGGGTVEEATAAEHHPARLQLFISTVHKTPVPTQMQCIYLCVLYCVLFKITFFLLEGEASCQRTRGDWWIQNNRRKVATCYLLLYWLCWNSMQTLKSWILSSTLSILRQSQDGVAETRCHYDLST